MMPRRPRRQSPQARARCRGVILVTVILVMIVLGLLAALLVRNLGGQYMAGTLAQQSRQAGYAAQSGIEWGRERALQAGICGTSQFSLADFTVTVTCATVQVTEGAAIYDVYDVTAEAQHGAYGNPDFVRRRLQSRFSNR
jgi:type II secretory pathway pseudopilin PulG